MQINELRENRLRELARIHPDDAKVLSVFLNLDPSEFAAPPARATEISSVIDDATRRIREREGLSQAERKGLVDDVHGQHSQGGWSQARYQRSVDEDVQDHLRNVADAVWRSFKRRSFDHL